MWTAADETGDLLFSHTEYLGDIVGNGGTFDMNRIIYINPGLKDSFPVLARIASLFAEYRFERLIFIYKTLVTSGNGVAAGSVEMATRYNPDASDYTTKAQMKDADYSVGGKVDDEIVCGIECKQERNAVDGRLYIRTTPLGEYSSLHTYDMAKVEIALNNVPKDLLVGELYVAYTCRLCKMTNTTDMEPLPLNNGFSLSLVPVVDPQRWEYVTYGWIGTRSLQNNIWINGGIEDRGQIMNPQTFPLPTWQTTTGNSANWLPGGPELSGRGIVTIDAGEEQANGVGDSMMVETYNMHSSIQFSMRVYQGRPDGGSVLALAVQRSATGPLSLCHDRASQRHDRGRPLDAAVQCGGADLQRPRALHGQRWKVPDRQDAADPNRPIPDCLARQCEQVHVHCGVHRGHARRTACAVCASGKPHGCVQCLHSVLRECFVQVCSHRLTRRRWE